MARAFTNYICDLDRAYPMYPMSVVQKGDIATNLDPVSLLPDTIVNSIRTTRHVCAVPGLTARKLSLWTSEGANFTIDYPQPFDEVLAIYLTAHLSIAAWEFIGERLKYGRLQKLLDNAQS